MIKLLAKQKFRFDIGASFLSILNFAFVVIAASDKLSLLVNVPVRYMVIVLVPLAMLSVWIFGFILDKSNFQHLYQEEQNQRNNMLKKAVGL